MDRRTFLAGTGAMLLAAPLAVEAQAAGRYGGSASWLSRTRASTTRSSLSYASSVMSKVRTLPWSFAAPRKMSNGSPPSPMSY